MFICLLVSASVYRLPRGGRSPYVNVLTVSLLTGNLTQDKESAARITTAQRKCQGRFKGIRAFPFQSTGYQNEQSLHIVN